MGSTNSTAVAARTDVNADEVDEAAEFALRTEGQKDLSTRVELTFDGNLRFRKNCFLLIYARRSVEPTWRKVGQTEVINDTAEPRFVRSVVIEYEFEVQQKLRVEMYSHINMSSDDPEQQEFIGDAECFLASVLGGLDAHETLDLDNEKMPQPGTVEIWAEEVTSAKSYVQFQAQYSPNVPRGGFIAQILKPTMYFVVNRVSTDGHERLTPIFKSDALTTHAIAQGDLFEEVTLSVQQLCRGDEYRNVKIQLFLAGLSRRGPELVSEGARGGR
jgi:hypothetical protein